MSWQHGYLLAGGCFVAGVLTAVVTVVALFAWIMKGWGP